MDLVTWCLGQEDEQERRGLGVDEEQMTDLPRHACPSVPCHLEAECTAPVKENTGGEEGPAAEDGWGHGEAAPSSSKWAQVFRPHELQSREQEDLAGVIEESHCNLWKSWTEGTWPENPGGKKCSKFQSKGCQQPSGHGSVPHVPRGWAPWRLGSLRQLSREAQTCPAHKKAGLPTNPVDKTLLARLDLMNAGLGPALLHYTFSFSYRSNNPAVNYLHLLSTYYMPGSCFSNSKLLSPQESTLIPDRDP